MPLQRAEAGVCARRRSNFLLRRQEKVTKEKATPSLRPPFALSGERGQPAMLGSGVGVAELAAFFELRSDSSDEPEDEACVSFGTHAHPSSCASRRSQQGWGAGTTRLLLRSCAGCRFALCAADVLSAIALASQAQRRTTGPSEAMARVEPDPTPSDRAEKRRAWGERVPKDTRIVIWLAEAV